MACKINFSKDSRYGRFSVVFWPFIDTHSTSFRGLGFTLYSQPASFLWAYVVIFSPWTLGSTLVVINHAYPLFFTAAVVIFPYASTGEFVFFYYPVTQFCTVLTFVPLWLWVYHWWRRLMGQSLLHSSRLLGIITFHFWILFFVIRYCPVIQSLGSNKYSQLAIFIMRVLADRISPTEVAPAVLPTRRSKRASQRKNIARKPLTKITAREGTIEHLEQSGEYHPVDAGSEALSKILEFETNNDHSSQKEEEEHT